MTILNFVNFCGLDLRLTGTKFMDMKVNYFQKLLGLVLIAIYYSKDIFYERTTSGKSLQLSTHQKEKEKTLQENLVIERVAAIHVLCEYL